MAVNLSRIQLVRRLPVDVPGRDIRVARRQSVPEAAAVTNERLHVSEGVDERRAEERAAVAAPAPARVGVAGAVLVRHLQRHRHAVEALRDLIRGNPRVAFACRVSIVPDFSLDVGVGPHVGCEEGAVERLETWSPDLPT